MFAMFKLCAILALAAPFVSALTITTISGNVVSEGSITITWTTSTSDAAGTFSIELDHPSFNSALGIANNVDSSSLSITIALPNVPAQSGYTIEFVAIDDINTVFTTSNSFSIGAVSATLSTTVTGASSTPSSKSVSTTGSASGSASASVTPLSTKPAPSTTNTGFGNTVPPSATSPATSATSSPSPSTTGSSGALVARSVLGGSLSGALLVALGVIAGAFAL
ncbi:hypothetical protein B0H11DRAFT_2051441 [Mycena galericulata]|nr:hypothetical protein B0H11DRAFT_2051441 [Mycena galericulata]